jgi:hypothetical protein
MMPASKRHASRRKKGRSQASRRREVKIHEARMLIDKARQEQQEKILERMKSENAELFKDEEE